MAEGKIERREHERVTARIKVRYQIISGELADRLIAKNDYKDVSMGADTSGRVKDMMTVVAENISVSGMGLVGDTPFEPGQSLGVELLMPQSPRPIKALATVMRIFSTGKEGTYGAGVRFIGINRKDVDILNAYVTKNAKKPA